MNHIRVREVAKEMFKAHLFGQRTMLALATAPLFSYKSNGKRMEPDEVEWCREHIFDKGLLQKGVLVPAVMPYKTLIIHEDVRNPFHPEEKSGVTYFVFTGEHEPIVKQKDGSTACLTVLRQDILEGDKCWMAISILNTRGQKSEVLFSCFVNGKPVPADKLGRDSSLCKEMISMVVNVLSKFAFDTMSHFCVTVKSSPKQTPGKSVEWHIARTHYLIVSRKDAAKCRDRKASITDHEVVRAAHMRKAHFRKLVSAKFRNKCGQTVPVKQAWVGPKEWEGTDGKIYQIIE